MKQLLNIGSMNFLQSTFNFYIDIFNKKGLFKHNPLLKEDLYSQYELATQENLSSEINLIEEFFLNVYTGINGESYDVSWSIPKANKLISENSINFEEVNMKHLYSDSENLEENKLRYFEKINTNEFNPIIVTYYLPIKKLVVIDGNHRFYWSLLRGKKVIKAYLLSPYSNSIIMNQRSFKKYTFHHNLVNLLQFCCNPLSWKFENNKSLDWDTYFGKTEIENSFFKKVNLLVKPPYIPKPK